MKNLNRLAFAILLVFAVVNVNAQDKNNPWQVTIGVNAVDALGTGNQVGNEDIGFSKLYSVSEWSVLSAPSMISVGKYLDDSFSFGISGTFNKIDKWNTYGRPSEAATSVEELIYYGLDGMVKYSFSELLNSKKIEPPKIKNIN